MFPKFECAALLIEASMSISADILTASGVAIGGAGLELGAADKVRLPIGMSFSIGSISVLPGIAYATVGGAKAGTT